MRQEIILIIGNIGSGKTTLANKLLKENTILISLDEIEKQIIDQSGAFNMHEIEHQVNSKLLAALDKKQRVIIDGNLMSVDDRKLFCKFAYMRNYSIICYDFGPGNKKSLNRRIKDSPKLSSEQWSNIYESKLKRYSPPSLDEGFNQIHTCYKKNQ
jgi:predicted kinase